MRNRFHVPDLPAPGGIVHLSGDEFHHAARVHRSKQGEEVELFDGSGRAVRARFSLLARDHAELEVIDEIGDVRESPLRITVALALIQSDRFELVLQKGTELGANAFVPMITERSEVPPARVAGKRDRWARIVLEAAKQSGRATVPVIHEPAPFTSLVRGDGNVWLLEGEHDAHDGSTSAEPAVTLLVGPEGGWSDEELETARRSAVRFVRLGPRRLRAETAALAAVTAAQLSGGDFGKL